MNYFHSRFYAKLFLIRFFHCMQNRRIYIRLPTGISTCHCYFHSGHRETAFKTCSQILFHAVTWATSKNLDICLTTTNTNNSQVRRSFYGIRNGRNHAGYPILTGKDSIYQIILNLFRNLPCRHIYPFGFETDRSLDSRKLFIEKILTVFYQA